MIRIAVCDDNPEELSLIKSLLEEYQAKHHAEYQYMLFQNGMELMSFLEKGHVFHIYCLDIIMSGFSGIQLGKEIRALDKSAQILFLTSSPEFALESYSVRAVDYMLKPVKKEAFFDVLTELLGQLCKEQAASIIIKSQNSLKKIMLGQLVYVEAMGRKVFYHLISGQAIESTVKFSVVCDNLLKQPGFLQPHRSYLVNMCYIDTIDSAQIVLQTQVSIPIARDRAKEIRKCYLTFQMEEF